MRKINLIGTIILIGILGFSIFIGNITKQSFLNIEVSKILNNRDEKKFFLDDSLNLFKTPLKYEELYSNSDTYVLSVGLSILQISASISSENIFTESTIFPSNF